MAACFDLCPILSFRSDNPYHHYLFGWSVLYHLFAIAFFVVFYAVGFEVTSHE